ncbi:nucleoside triphosphate pyrophosphohydrolase [Gulosibacter sp. ACHW.36C]|uniref:MazG family protein n=1 Tax=Gulosibacter sediminis TaxID=1729695 RepID=A0ABY4MZA8_9MICO|nr:MazG family protein [Gulosibacter sediminis]UQN15729.1 MazG family protein [Gulosibacter sediminis]
MTSEAMQELIATVERFRGDGGCAWFEAQTHRSLVKYLVEETAELVDAIEAGDEAEMREELGDVLFQVLFHANIAAERGTFTLDDVANEQRDKLVRRNPHVFGPTPTRDIDEIIRMWEEAKAIEKRDRTSVLDGIARSMPALALAEKVLGRGARVDARLAAPLEAGGDAAEAAFGDELLASIERARGEGIDAERALRGAVRRLEGRIREAESR